MSDLPEFSEGERIEVRGHTYEIDDVDYVPRGDEMQVLQYRLEPIEGSPARLEPKHNTGVFIFTEYHEVDASGIEW